MVLDPFENVYVKKLKIYPSKNQKETFDFWLRRCCYLYNIALEEQQRYYYVYKNNSTVYVPHLDVFKQKRELKDIKQYDKSWFDVPNKSLQEIIFRIDKGYTAFFERKDQGVGLPHFKKEINTIEFVKTDIRIKKGKLYLPKIKTSVKFKEEIPFDYSSVKLSKDGDNYFLIFTYKEVLSINPLNEDILGVDLGLITLATDSNGRKIDRFSKKLSKKYYDRIGKLNKTKDKKIKGSKRYKKCQKQIKKAYNRLKNTRNDYLRKSAAELVGGCSESYIFVGDIEIQKIVNKYKGVWDKKGLIKSIYNTALGIFKQYVLQEAIKYNKVCILVDEKNTSKTCSCCGTVNHGLKLSDREYHCLNSNCKYNRESRNEVPLRSSIDRDHNSAINMKLLGSSILALQKVKVV